MTQNLKPVVDTIYDIPLQQALVTRHIYLTEALEEPSAYIKTCQAILELQEGDCCEIHIASSGGRMTISDLICNAISKCKAHVKCILESNADSAASIIFLMGDEWEVPPNSTMYLHPGFFGAYGEKASDTVLDAKFTEEVHFNTFRIAYEGFLSEEEIESLLEGNNIRLNAEAIIERLEKLSEYRQKKMEELYQASLETSEEQLEDVTEEVEAISESEVTLQEIFITGEAQETIAVLSCEDGNAVELTYLGGEVPITLPLNEKVLQKVYNTTFVDEVLVKCFGLEDRTFPDDEMDAYLINCCQGLCEK